MDQIIATAGHTHIFKHVVVRFMPVTAVIVLINQLNRYVKNINYINMKVSCSKSNRNSNPAYVTTFVNNCNLSIYHNRIRDRG